MAGGLGQVTGKAPGWPPFLFKNDGSGTLTRVTTGALVETSACAVKGVWGDMDRDGDLDLFVVHYDCAATYSGSDTGNFANVLWRNDGEDVFTKITSGPIASEASCQRWHDAAWGGKRAPERASNQHLTPRSLRAP